MGTCWSCEKQLMLGENQTHCDNCGNLVYYTCWNCKNTFETADVNGKKRKECKICGYFYCPECGCCGSNCQKKEWNNKIKELIPNVTEEQIKMLIDYFEVIKTSNERKECINHIPITYAKGRIKSLLAKLEGFRVKNNTDRTAFENRIDKTTEKPIGTKLIISKIREDGSYGQEYRDAFNLLVCLGKLKLTWIKKEDGEQYALYERIDGQKCKYLNAESLIIYECPKCNKQYPKGVYQCKCSQYKKGKNKGQFPIIKARLNNCDICQMYRGDFNGKFK